MSFFNLRRGGTSSKSTASLGAPAESLEIVRKRAKHRLIGSGVLVLLGVIGFPLLFDTQPRPVSVGIPIEIPSKQGAKPLSLPAAAEREVIAAAPPAAPVTAEAPPTPAVSNPAPAVAKDVEATPAAPTAPTATPAVVESRLVVQVGAFADAAKAREARLKLEKAGLKTYTQVAETKDGKRIRVRVGPFATKAEADKAIKQVKALGLPAATLTL